MAALIPVPPGGSYLSFTQNVVDVFNSGVESFNLIVRHSEPLNDFTRFTAAGMKVLNPKRFKVATEYLRGIASCTDCFQIVRTIKNVLTQPFDVNDINHIKRVSFDIVNLNDLVSYAQDKKAFNIGKAGPVLGKAATFCVTLGFTISVGLRFKDWLEPKISNKLDEDLSRFTQLKTSLKNEKSHVLLKTASDFLELAQIVMPFFVKMNKTHRSLMTLFSKAASLGAFVIEKKKTN